MPSAPCPRITILEYSQIGAGEVRVYSKYSQVGHSVELLRALHPGGDVPSAIDHEQVRCRLSVVKLCYLTPFRFAVTNLRPADALLPYKPLDFPFFLIERHPDQGQSALLVLPVELLE